mmetsp:Transcript_102533/g.299100  ORF Transcript_102533/g.299100 Transcript_102533/m.299100 type:complete len:325 (+) Transcript_102533:225-1199(+)
MISHKSTPRLLKSPPLDQRPSAGTPMQSRHCKRLGPARATSGHRPRRGRWRSLTATKRASTAALCKPPRHAIPVEVVAAGQLGDLVAFLEAAQANGAAASQEVSRGCRREVLGAPCGRDRLRRGLVESEEQVIVLGRDLTEEQAVHLRRREAARQPPALAVLWPPAPVVAAVVRVAAVARAMVVMPLLAARRAAVAWDLHRPPPRLARVRLHHVRPAVRAAPRPVPGLARRRLHAPAALPAPGVRSLRVALEVRDPSDGVIPQPLQREPPLRAPLPLLPAWIPLDREVACPARICLCDPQPFHTVALVRPVDVGPETLKSRDRA